MFVASTMDASLRKEVLDFVVAQGPTARNVAGTQGFTEERDAEYRLSLVTEQRCMSPGFTGYRCPQCGTRTTRGSIDGIHASLACFYYSFASEWSVEQFETAFRQKLEDCLPVLDIDSMKRVGFRYYGCREKHVPHAVDDCAEHWCFSILVQFEDVVRYRDVQKRFGLSGLLEPLEVYFPSFKGCNHGNRSLADWSRWYQSWIGAVAPEEQFGACFDHRQVFSEDGGREDFPPKGSLPMKDDNMMCGPGRY